MLYFGYYKPRLAALSIPRQPSSGCLWLKWKPIDDGEWDEKIYIYICMYVFNRSRKLNATGLFMSSELIDDAFFCAAIICTTCNSFD